LRSFLLFHPLELSLHNQGAFSGEALLSHTHALFLKKIHTTKPTMISPPRIRIREIRDTFTTELKIKREAAPISKALIAP
jgi:hypothetical protein